MSRINPSPEDRMIVAYYTTRKTAETIHQCIPDDHRVYYWADVMELENESDLEKWKNLGLAMAYAMARTMGAKHQEPSEPSAG